MNAKFILLIVILSALSVIQGAFLSLAVFGMLLVLCFIYNYFYTECPKQIWVFFVAGTAIGVVNWYHSVAVYISAFAGIAVLECLRVFVVAILKYPETIHGLQSLTLELEKRVEERTAELRDANERLQKLNRELMELDKMKSSFVSQASHDLRTPLAAIKGSLDNLAIGVAGPLSEKQLRILDRATRSVDRLTDLVNEILDLNRIESGRTVLEKSRLSLGTIVDHIVQEYQTAAEKKQIQINVHSQNDKVIVEADPGKIERIFGELVNNAIKYTPDGGTVEVKLEKKNGNAVFSVKDSGIGMTKEECQKIWDRFYRTDTSQFIAKGSGLGLSIAKELVEMHGGQITVESEKEKGSRFTVILPVKSEGEKNDR